MSPNLHKQPQKVIWSRAAKRWMRMAVFRVPSNITIANKSPPEFCQRSFIRMTNRISIPCPCIFHSIYTAMCVYNLLELFVSDAPPRFLQPTAMNLIRRSMGISFMVSDCSYSFHRCCSADCNLYATSDFLSNTLTSQEDKSQVHKWQS